MTNDQFIRTSTKLFSSLVLVVCTIVLVAQIVCGVLASYAYENEIGSFWSLADKSSTIDKKSEYIDQFVAKLDSVSMAQNNAIFLKTLDNSTVENIRAIKTLQNRLHDINTMDVKSFEYQTAIQQITAQEQGEAQAVIGTVHGAWTLQHYPNTWDWIDGTLTIGSIIIGIIAIIVLFRAFRIFEILSDRLLL